MHLWRHRRNPVRGLGVHTFPRASPPAPWPDCCAVHANWESGPPPQSRPMGRSGEVCCCYAKELPGEGRAKAEGDAGPWEGAEGPHPRKRLFEPGG